MLVGGTSTTVDLLGRARINLAGRWLEPAPGKLSALLYYLAYREDWVSRRELMYLFWPDTDEIKASANLRQLLVKLFKGPFAAGLERHERRLCWQVGTDVRAFREAVRHKDWESASAAYRGALLEGFRLANAPEFESWLELEREALHQAWRNALLEASDALGATGRHAQAVALLTRLLRADPLDEEAVQHYMKQAWASSQESQAHKTYDGFRRALHQELGETPDRRTLTLAERIRAGAPYPSAAGAAVQVMPPKPASHLPRANTPFVGREQETRELLSLLKQPEVHLVSLVAPGGMGKTRLALAVAEALGDTLKDGAAFASFAAVNAPEQMVSTLAQALELSFTGPQDHKAQLLAYLKDKELLLVLDNLEHLRESDLIPELLTTSSTLRLLTTSRERLELSAEWVYDLKGLSYPPASAAPDSLAAFDAIAFFKQAAERAQHEPLDGLDLAIVAEICRLVEGMPLALELVAAWLRVLTLQEVQKEVQGGLELFQGELRDLPERHRSLMRVFEATWQRLAPQEQEAWARLSVFEGGFTREAAAEVAGVTLPQLLLLTNKALVAHEHGRFGQHPLLKQYGRQRLLELGLAAEASKQHAQHYLGWLEAKQEALGSEQRGSLLKQFLIEIDNLRKAWRWAAAQGDTALIDGALEPICLLFSSLTEWRELLELLRQAVVSLQEGSAVHARVRLRIAHSIWRFEQKSDMDEIEQLANESLQVFQKLQRNHDVADALNTLAINALLRPDLELAEKHLRASYAAATTAGEASVTSGLLSKVTGNLAVIVMNRREYEEARELYRLSAEYGQAHLGAREERLYNWALLERHLGNYEMARSLIEESLSLARQDQQPELLAQRLNITGHVLKSMGHLKEATPYFLEEIAAVQALHENIKQMLAGRAITHLGHIAWHSGDLAEGRRLLSEVGSHLLARLALEEGKLDEAEALCQQHLGKEWFPSVDHYSIKTYLLACSAEVALAKRDLKLARTRLVEALDYTLWTKLPPGILRALAGWADYLWRTSRPDLAAQAARLALSHPAGDFELRLTIERLLQQLPDLAAILPPVVSVELEAFARSLLGQ